MQKHLRECITSLANLEYLRVQEYHIQFARNKTAAIEAFPATSYILQLNLFLPALLRLDQVGGGGGLPARSQIETAGSRTTYMRRQCMLRMSYIAIVVNSPTSEPPYPSALLTVSSHGQHTRQ
jgi:hypothetical protein